MNVFRKFLSDNRRSLTGWTLAIAAVAAMYAGFWPTIGGNADMLKAMESYPDAIKQAFHMEDMSTPASYLGSSVFGLLIPMLVAIFAIAYGVKAIAGDEEAGTLDLTLAHPVGRLALALQRFGAIAVGLAVVGGGVLLAMLALRGPADLGRITVGDFIATCLQLALFGLVFAGLAYAVGAATGRKTLALATGAAAVVVSYLADSFFVQVDALTWTERLSPFEWYIGGEPLKHGVQWGDSALLLGVSLTLVALGTWRFHRRDIAV
ncbi:MAG: ABC transporter permease subunit [Hamadaea sp.]|nr:ABC transporter permease subunit [Hamadaea sp.]